MNNLIVCIKNVSFGMPTLRGRRLTVYDIVSKIYYEETVEDALKDYEISFEEAKAAVTYCMNLDCQKDINRIQFCNGCILRTINEGLDFDKENYIEVNDKYTISKDGLLTFLGSIEELKEERFGKPGWAIAELVFSKMR